MVRTQIRLSSPLLDGGGLFVNPRYVVLFFILSRLELKDILATSVDVERTFSQGRLLLSHIRSRLSVQSRRALLCVGVWSLKGYVKDDDVKSAAVLREVDGAEEELADDCPN